MIEILLNSSAMNELILAQMGFCLSSKILQWLYDNCDQLDWHLIHHSNSLWFRFDEDAVAFKIVFIEYCE